MEGSVSTDTLVCVCDIVTVRFHPVVKVLLTQCGDCQWKVVCLFVSIVYVSLCVIFLCTYSSMHVHCVCVHMHVCIYLN